ncbi:recombinase family protein [Escherichia coli]|uniref:recombinase family protein n=1 Tax=Escherichia coli TaxID=562 RepID=UPI001C5D20B6|nr:recombinase family protein [Escherichia coli]MCZ0319076.1 recombinase family protein [Escherichia coli]
MGMKFVYRRVSTTSQKTDRQLPDMPFEDTDDYRVYEDKTSGKNFDRPAWKALRACIRKGDDLYIHSLDRMGRNLLEILKEIDELVKKVKVNLHIVKDNIHLEGGEELSAMVELQLNIMAAVAQMERKLIAERRQEGIAAAKAAGKHCGRPPLGLRRAEVDEKAVLAALAEGNSIRKVAKDFNISKNMVCRIKEEAAEDKAA